MYNHSYLVALVIHTGTWFVCSVFQLGHLIPLLQQYLGISSHHCCNIWKGI